MSSFKPDPALAKLGFRSFPAGGKSARDFRPNLAGERPAEIEVPEVPACTPAQHAALEDAAFEKGRASAEADFARCEQACAVFEEAAAALDRVAARRLLENRETILELAAEIARHWIAEELRVDPARYAGPLDRALSLCADAPAARIHLHPEVLAALETSLPEWLSRWSERLEVEIAADAALAPGAFRIDAGAQAVDAGFDALGARLREALGTAFTAPAPEATAC
ncbi:MAG: FliH/SctL family protein [Myxococcota bacterium]